MARRGQLRRPKIISCVCCGKTGEHKGRGLRSTCWDRYSKSGTLEQFPGIRVPDPRIMALRTQTILERVEFFAEMVEAGYRREYIAERLGVSERTLTRYSAHLRNTQEGGD